MVPMKPSGLGTVTAIPASWEMRRNSGLFRERRDKNHPDLEMLSVTQSRGVVPQASLESRVTAPSDDRTGYSRVLAGDLVYNKMRMWQGAVGVAPAEGIVSTAYVVMEPRPGTNSRYYEYLYRTPAFLCESGRFSYGLCDDMNSLRAEHFRGMLSPVPAPAEQDSVVGFLDSEIARIDALIDRKQHFIDLLLEKRTAVATYAVTKGLDPDVEMMDSGVDWLGPVPRHWRRSRVKFIARQVSRAAQADSRDEFIALEDIASWTGERGEPDPGERELTGTACQRNDVLFGKLRPYLAKIHTVSRQRAVCSSEFVVLRPSREIVPRYLQSILASRTLIDWVNAATYGTKMPRMSPPTLMALPVPVPPIDEQRTIVEAISEESRRTQCIVERTRDSIELLREYRTALISAAVTGQIDIPGTDETEDVA